MKTRRPYGGKWSRIRQLILERDSWTCRIGGQGCTQQATEVDHIVPWAAGGAWYDPANLRASCRNCNQQRKTTRGSRNWQTAGVHITLVKGGGVAGLSDWVRAHAAAGDLVVDRPTLARGMGMAVHAEAEAVDTMWRALVGKLRRGELQAERAWITSTSPTAAADIPHHELVEIDGEAIDVDVLDPGGAGGGGGGRHRSSVDRSPSAPTITATSTRPTIAPSRAW